MLLPCSMRWRTALQVQALLSPRLARPLPLPQALPVLAAEGLQAALGRAAGCAWEGRQRRAPALPPAAGQLSVLPAGLRLRIHGSHQRAAHPQHLQCESRRAAAARTLATAATRLTPGGFGAMHPLRPPLNGGATTCS